MQNKSHHSTRYDAAGGSENQYMDEAKMVMKNKKNIADLLALQIQEEKSLVHAYELLLFEHVRIR